MIGIKIEADQFNSIVAAQAILDDQWSTDANYDDDSNPLIIDDIPCAQSTLNEISFKSEENDFEFSTAPSTNHEDDFGNEYESLALFFENFNLAKDLDYYGFNLDDSFEIMKHAKLHNYTSFQGLYKGVSMEHLKLTTQTDFFFTTLIDLYNGFSLIEIENNRLVLDSQYSLQSSNNIYLDYMNKFVNSHALCFQFIFKLKQNIFKEKYFKI